ncbi:hypothetical protein ACS0TY_017754 [Phlomoides rotata]
MTESPLLLPQCLIPSPPHLLQYFSSSLPLLFLASFRRNQNKIGRKKNCCGEQDKREREEMIPEWAPPCNTQCTHKYATLMQIPWRVFCKKGCDADGETLDECLGECDEICYKDPVLKDQQWSAYIDRSPGSATYSEFETPSDVIDQVHSRDPKPPPEEKPSPSTSESPVSNSKPTKDEIPSTSA